MHSAMRQVERVEKGHGRVECRRLSVLPVVHKIQGWPNVAQICRIERTRFLPATNTEQRGVFYFITSLSQTQASPDVLMRLIRNHWSIENHLHWQKDTLLGEDRSTTRARNGPRNLALLRSFVLFALKKNGLKPKKTIESLANKPLKIAKLLSKTINCKA